MTSATTAVVKSVARKVSDPDGFSSPAMARDAASEEHQLREALRVAGGNKAVAARQLKLPRSTFFSKCKKYGIT